MGSVSGSQSFSGVNLGQSPFNTPAVSANQAGLLNAQLGIGMNPIQATPGNNGNANYNYGIANQAQGYAGQAAGAGQQGIITAQSLAGGPQGAASQLGALGSSLTGQFAGNTGAAQQALTDAFDPMQAQMKAGLAQTQDATGAALSGSGLASTPYGASVLAGSAGNFMNNWQTQQIQRENTGASTATGLQNQQLASQQAGGSLIDAAGQLDQGAMNSILSQYGLSEQGAASAAQTLSQIFGNLSTSQSQSKSISA